MIRRLLIGLVFAIFMIAVTLVLFRGPIAMTVMRQAAPQIMASDFVGSLDDGLHVLLCGAGGPLPDPQRSGPCVTVIAGKSVYVVDAGSGGSRNMQQMGVPPGLTEALFLTHFHSDHIDGLGELSMQRWAGSGRDSPLPVHAPGGVEEVVDGFNLAYRHDQGYRIAHHGAETVVPSGAGLKAVPFPLPTQRKSIVLISEAGLRVSAFQVEHAPVDPAVGYRFDYGGRSVVISGDTSKSDNLIFHARGVDLLIHEALDDKIVGVLEETATELDRPRLKKILSDIPGYHTSPVEAAEAAEEAGASHLLYYHVVPPLILPGMSAVFLEGTAKAFSGDITLGVDGTMISMPRDSQSIEVSKQ
ncbi:MAG: MBL fold metallo-hydrolase [bacterium]|nr:MBL fold metallo-hydrolase [bacterium]